MKLTPGVLAGFQRRLLAWFRANRRDFPWRRGRDPYRIWLAEVMLQQTRIAAVLPYYRRFLRKFPGVRALARAREANVLKAWSGLGYYGRARNLRRAAQQIVARHGGKFPRELGAALALPGVGRYTAAAVLSIAYGAPLAVLDGNVARVLARLFAVQDDLRDAKRWQSLQESANALLDPKSPGDWNQAVMELGATLCTPRAPQCLLCPVAEFCQARKLGLADSLPALRKKRATENIELAAAILLARHGHTLLLPPPTLPKGKAAHERVSVLVSKLWHFPTIAVRTDPAAELQAHLNEILPRSVAKQPLRLELLPAVRHAVTHHAITLRPFRVSVTELPRLPGAKTILLSDVTSPSSLAISNLTRKAARAALATPAALSARA
jgi:A/G-specific adenine glycosylase